MTKATVKFLPAILAASVLSLTSCEKNELDNMQNEVTTAQIQKTGGEGNYIVVLKDGQQATEEQMQQRAGDLLGSTQALTATKGFRSLAAIKGFSAQLTAQDAERLKNDSRVAYLEQDQQIQLFGSASTSTTMAASTTQVLSWGVTKVGGGNASTLARTAWIVDSGIQLNHPDLNVDVARSRSFVTGTTSPDDQFGHGTNVAGILGAKDNTFGVKGVAAGAKLVSLRVMNATGGGTISSVIAALNYVSLNGKPGDVVNLSFGSGASLALDNAVKAVANKGIYVTIAAGNSGANAANVSPARVNHPNVFTISGMRADNTFMGISNWGTPVDFTAPGTGLQSTKKGGLYGSVGGTSMAAPHVAGILLMKGAVATQGNVIGDPDGVADKISKF
jgi:hypothetical protein